jgi:hypothetical protein
MRCTTLGYFGAGFLVGFLFGIPRVLQGDGSRNSAPGSGGNYEQRVNTNLEQISDWLTKIIVGLGLVQLRTVPDHLYKAAQWMARSFTPNFTPEKAASEAAVSFAGAFIIFFSILGFLGGYLTTRLFIAGAFGRADRGPILVESAKSVADPTGSAPDDKANAEKLRSFWKPSGAENTENRGKLIRWLQSKARSDVPLADLINETSHAALRKEAVNFFKLP